MKHASIVPLIGGEAIASQNVFGTRPDFIMSYTPFQANDSHLLNYYNHEVPYYILDKGEMPTERAEIISTVCPCAGLSQLSHGFGDDNVNNQWLVDTTKFVLNDMKPKVLWGENAPGFAGKIGKTTREEMLEIADQAGYSMSVYRTKSLLHGVAQVRERAFYFFWEGDKVPVFEYYNRPRVTIEDTILSVANVNSMQIPINPKTPSKDDPWYRYILEVIHDGMSHKEFSSTMKPMSVRSNDVFGYIEKMGHDYLKVAEWMKKHNFIKEYEQSVYKYNKLQSGKSIMRRGTIIPKDYIGAFVNHYPVSLTHPVEDRYITYREALAIMGMPNDFEFLYPNKSKAYNQICQNVPVKTAEDMATEVKESLLGNRQWIEAKYLLQNNNFRTVAEEIKRNEANIMEFL